MLLLLKFLDIAIIVTCVIMVIFFILLLISFISWMIMGIIEFFG